MKERDHLARWY